MRHPLFASVAFLALSAGPVWAQNETELKPGAVRIRLKDLKKPLKAGDTVALTLTTDGGATIKVSAEVRKG